MPNATTLPQSVPIDRLRCLSCGNEDRFEQLVGFAINYVTGEGHVVREMMSEVSGYRCPKCGEPVEAPADWDVIVDEGST